MKYYRSVALVVSLCGGLALPALAQTASPDTAAAPKTETPSMMPDAGVKKAAPGPVKHAHHVSRHKAARTATPATKR